MTERERLIKLLDKVQDYGSSYLEYIHDDMTVANDYIGDYLLKNGVIVPPVKVGDTVYMIVYDYDNSIKIKEEKVTGIIYEFFVRENGFGLCLGINQYDYSAIGKTIFFSKEDAEKALKEI